MLHLLLQQLDFVRGEIEEAIDKVAQLSIGVGQSTREPCPCRFSPLTPLHLPQRAAEDSRTPRRGRALPGPRNRDASWSAAVLCRFSVRAQGIRHPERPHARSGRLLRPELWPNSLRHLIATAADGSGKGIDKRPLSVYLPTVIATPIWRRTAPSASDQTILVWPCTAQAHSSPWTRTGATPPRRCACGRP
jgi:hypothetical protein